MPNAYVTVLVKEVFNNALKISKEYVLLDTKSVYVYIIRDGKIIRENLNILADNDTFFIVQNTFLPNDKLIIQTVNPQDEGKNATSKNKESI